MSSHHDAEAPIPPCQLIGSFRFLLVSLSIESILQESTVHRRRERLGKMTDGPGLEGVYGATIERIKVQGGDKSRLGLGALMWVSYAEQPLAAGELCHALAIELGSKNFNPDNVPSIATLVGCCQGLISVDKEGTTVRLIHFTLKEYLSARPDIFCWPHSAIAEICLTYLNSQHVKALVAESWVPNELEPFLIYCSAYWGVHAKRELSDCARSLALELLQEYDDHISARLLIEHNPEIYGYFPEEYFPEESDAPIRFGGQHCASFFGIVEVLAALIEMQGYCTGEGYLFEDSPLAWAARSGHEEVVKILLARQDVDPDEANEYGRTPLSYAAQEGNVEVVNILLLRDEVNPDMPDNVGCTPLWYAVTEGYEGVAKILLGRGEVSPDQPDVGGRTPLSHAAGSGFVGIVKALLGRKEVDPDTPDHFGLTPLWYAVTEGYECVAKILLGREEVSSDRLDGDGRTLLSYAAGSGFEGIVNALLGREEVNPNMPDDYGLTPLWYAVTEGHEGVAKILLGREEVNAEKPDEGW